MRHEIKGVRRMEVEALFKKNEHVFRCGEYINKLFQ